MLNRVILISAAWTIGTLSPAWSQGAGICDRKFDETRAFIDAQSEKWSESIKTNNFPKEVEHAYLVIVKYSHDNSLNGAEVKRVECTAQYVPAQEIMNTAVLLFSAGLSSIAPGKSAYVDVSEILNGYPLGGPNALIPKLREQILDGDRGAVANIIRDPWKCLTFQRKC